MTKNSFGYVSQLVRLQEELVRALMNQYPAGKDLDWLLDFPKKGVIRINTDDWEFTRHGCGMRFIRKTTEPHYIVDMHRVIREPRCIDGWRLLQFLESCGEQIDEQKIAALLRDMVSDGTLFPSENGLFFLPEAQ
jgi:hypothetical protein